MKLDRLVSFFANHPSAKLLRSPHAPYIAYFLNSHFKVAGNLASPQAILQQRLAEFLENLHENLPDVMRDKPDAYLTQWSTGDQRWLNRTFDIQHSEPVYQLAAATESVLKFLTELLDRDINFVGTESRLKRIIETLSDLMVRGSDDPSRRLEYLKAERKKIDEEIEAIRSGKVISKYTPTAIRERFSDAVSDLKSLQGDFRAVEESFKNITRDVQKQQSQSTDSRGVILGFALEAEERLKSEDQGVSFHEFVRLILSQNKQDELEKIIGMLDQIEELAEQTEGKLRLKGMIDSLAAEAEKVLRTTRRLSNTLRRLLDSRASGGRQRLAEVLRAIQTAAAQRADDPLDIGVDIYTDLDLQNAASRTFWESPVQFETIMLNNKQPDEDDRLLAFRDLAQLQLLNWESMRSNISAVLKTCDQTSLPDLLDIHPPSSGAVEVLGYIQLAHDDGHCVDEKQFDNITLEAVQSDGRPILQSYEIPKVTFTRRIAAQNRGLKP